MTVTFDPEWGRLRLDAAAFDSLVAWAGGGQPDLPRSSPMQE